jgi:hypothetical protein
VEFPDSGGRSALLVCSIRRASAATGIEGAAETKRLCGPHRTPHSCRRHSSSSGSICQGSSRKARLRGEAPTWLSRSARKATWLTRESRAGTSHVSEKATFSCPGSAREPGCRAGACVRRDSPAGPVLSIPLFIGGRRRRKPCVFAGLSSLQQARRRSRGRTRPGAAAGGRRPPRSRACSGSMCG